MKKKKLMIEFAGDGLGLHKVRLRVLAHNKYAIKCYLRNGFVEEGCFKDEVKLDGEWCDVIFIGKIVGRGIY